MNFFEVFMKIIVFSDSHGNSKAISRGLEMNARDLDMCVFLGDGTDDAEYALSAYPNVARVIVSGNREDGFSSFLSVQIPPREALFEAGGIKFLAMHGHRPADVKNGLAGAAKYGAEMGADVILYGHTHVQNDQVIEVGERKIRMINPGSARKSFALLDIVDGNVICGFGRV